MGRFPNAFGTFADAIGTCSYTLAQLASPFLPMKYPVFIFHFVYLRAGSGQKMLFRRSWYSLRSLVTELVRCLNNAIQHDVGLFFFARYEGEDLVREESKRKTACTTDAPWQGRQWPSWAWTATVYRIFRRWDTLMLMKVDKKLPWNMFARS
jgi:hypothetical protein